MVLKLLKAWLLIILAYISIWGVAWLYTYDQCKEFSPRIFSSETVEVTPSLTGYCKGNFSLQDLRDFEKEEEERGVQKEIEAGVKFLTGEK